MTDRADPVRIHLDLPTVRLAALDYGEPPPPAGQIGGEAPAISMLMLHGQADLAWSLHPVAAALSNRYRIVSLDLRGHGDSAQPGTYSLTHFIADVAAVIELLGLDRPIIVGHSLGGQIAAQFCGLFPEIPRALVVAEGIGPPVRMGAQDRAERLARARHWVELASQPLRLRPMATHGEAAKKLEVAHPGLGTRRAAFLAEVATKAGPDGGLVWKFDPYTRHWLFGHDQERAEERWAAVRCPVQVITGGQAWERWWKKQSPAARIEGWSDFDPQEIARRVACFADVEHHELADAGHMLPYDAPSELAALIETFLDKRLTVAR